MTRLAITVLAAFLLTSPFQILLAQTAWIGDSIFVPVRAGAGHGYRILHRGVRSGTEVDVLEWDADAGWSQVRVGDIDGWMETQYLSKTPVAALQLEEARNKLDTLHAELSTTRRAHTEIVKERNELRAQLQDMEQQLTDRNIKLTRLREVAADPLRLDEKNRELTESLSLLRIHRDQLEAESALLRNDKTVHIWLLALLTIIFGMTLGWYFTARAGRQRSTWS